jgi:hypothetical protein
MTSNVRALQVQFDSAKRARNIDLKHPSSTFTQVLKADKDAETQIFLMTSLFCDFLGRPRAIKAIHNLKWNISPKPALAMNTLVFGSFAII